MKSTFPFESCWLWRSTLTGLGCLLLSARAVALESAPGVGIANPDWIIVMTDEGYADVVLDNRPGFENREYLSGEWAASIFYVGGSNPDQPTWFRREWAFPCWETNSNFGVKEEVKIVSATPNADGFLVFRSIIENDDVEVTMTYQMRDSTTGLRQGEAPASEDGPGASSLSSRYFLQQTYSIKNISGGPLTGVTLYQFLHGLDSGVSIIDDRDYGGPFAEYHFDNTQRGEDLSFNNQSGEVFAHTDTITMHARKQPVEYEVGYYGVEGVDDHRKGKPSVGVHHSVEAMSLSNLDFFDPPEGRWVSGAMCFELPDIGPGETAECDVLLSLNTVSEFRHPAPDLHIFNTGFDDDGNFVIDFEDRNDVPVDGYILRASPDLKGKIGEDWTQVLVPRFIDTPRPGASRFVVPIDPEMESCFFVVEGIFAD